VDASDFGVGSPSARRQRPRLYLFAGEWWRVRGPRAAGTGAGEPRSGSVGGCRAPARMGMGMGMGMGKRKSFFFDYDTLNLGLRSIPIFGFAVIVL
jgi:hypothetical protein